MCLYRKQADCGLFHSDAAVDPSWFLRRKGTSRTPKETRNAISLTEGGLWGKEIFDQVACL